MQDTYKKMLRRKIVYLKKIYKFDFDTFSIKRIVFILIVKNGIKNQKFNFSDELRHTKKMLRKKIVHFKKIYKFYIKHFLIGIILFLINIKNVIK